MRWLEMGNLSQTEEVSHTPNFKNCFPVDGLSKAVKPRVPGQKSFSDHVSPDENFAKVALSTPGYCGCPQGIQEPR